MLDKDEEEMLMKYRRLGETGLKVSEISLGSWLTYGGYVDSENAINTIHKAYDLGINFFDTANVYMRGEAEKVVGQAIQSFPRESYVLATKVFNPMEKDQMTKAYHASIFWNKLMPA